MAGSFDAGELDSGNNDDASFGICSSELAYFKNASRSGSVKK